MRSEESNGTPSRLHCPDEPPTYPVQARKRRSREEMTISGFPNSRVYGDRLLMMHQKRFHRLFDLCDPDKIHTIVSPALSTFADRAICRRRFKDHLPVRQRAPSLRIALKDRRIEGHNG